MIGKHASSEFIRYEQNSKPKYRRQESIYDELSVSI